MAGVFVERIIVYPIKSLDGVSVCECRITDGGSLEHDRLLAIVDEQGTFVNAKRFAKIHAIRAVYTEDFRAVTLSAPDKPAHQFSMEDRDRMSLWFSDFFEMNLRIMQNTQTGFPDDLEASGPTFVASATLQRVCEWFAASGQGFKFEEAIRRFRPNVLFGGADSFYEDQLYGGATFFAGDVTVVGSNPCARCAVPSRHPSTGEVIQGFSKTLSDARKKHLPATSNADHFSHYYRLCLNTRIHSSETGKTLRVGDAVQTEWDSWGKIF